MTYTYPSPFESNYLLAYVPRFPRAVLAGVVVVSLIMLQPELMGQYQYRPLDQTSKSMLATAETMLRSKYPQNAVGMYRDLIWRLIQTRQSSRPSGPATGRRPASHYPQAGNPYGQRQSYPRGSSHYRPGNANPAGRSPGRPFGHAVGPVVRQQTTWTVADIEAADSSVLPFEILVGAAIAYQSAQQPRLALALYLKASKYSAVEAQSANWSQRDVYVMLGDCYHKFNRFDQALRAYENALRKPERRTWQRGSSPLRKEGSFPSRAELELRMGEMQTVMGQYEDARRRFQRAWRFQQSCASNSTTPKASRAYYLTCLARVYTEMGFYGKATNCLFEAVQEDMDRQEYTRVVENRKQQGRIARELGDPGMALKILANSLDMAMERLPREYAILADIRGEMGDTFMDMGNCEKALAMYQKAMGSTELSLDAIPRRPVDEDDSGQFPGLDRFAYFVGRGAEAMVGMGRYEDARARLTSSIETLNMMKKSQDVMPLILSLGHLARLQGRPEEALTTLTKGLKQVRAQGNLALLADFHRGLGDVCRDLKKGPDTIKHYRAAIGIIEKLRQMTYGTVRRDYLASQIDAYQMLTETYVECSELENALKTTELSTAKYLVEQLDGEKVGNSSDEALDVQALLGQLPAGTAVVRYANAGRRRLIVFVVTSAGLSAVVVDTHAQLARQRDVAVATAPFAGKDVARGLRRVVRENEANHTAHTTELEKAIRVYREALIGQTGASREQVKAHLRKSGGLLYRCLIAPIEDRLVNVSRLLIVPDGALAVIPLEALVMPDGKYLVEKYDIGYVQSLRIAQILRGRTYTHPRKSLLAFGGAVYEPDIPKQQHVEGEHQKGSILDGVVPSRSNGHAYGSLGYGQWSDLPGTLEEVQAVGELYRDARVVTGAEVTETSLKKMDARGELRRYRMLHFATHGLVVPKVPKLSALVLSQTEKGGPRGEDGYLRMQEVAKLRLAADVVTLSACETGLGKVYSGEGVVGLGQAFLVAGANGLTLSLWQVADESTKTFMVDVYRLVQKEDITFSESLTRTKRSFIGSRKHFHPFYWAPFVYYGQ